MRIIFVRGSSASRTTALAPQQHAIARKLSCRTRQIELRKDGAPGARRLSGEVAVVSVADVGALRRSPGS